MRGHILVTGSSGLIGAAVVEKLKRRGEAVFQLDLRGTGSSGGDVRDAATIRNALIGARGVVHLAAVSRVVWAERDPATCRSTNVDALRGLLSAMAESRERPWCVFASSREVYGEASTLPVTEDAPLSPLNVYARSKVEGERLIERARSAGLRAATVRLSNVYGSALDHADRVVPAFVRAALAAEVLRLEGGSNTFDFTHVDDVSRGLVELVALMDSSEAPPPPIHFVSGKGTTLEELASLTLDTCRSRSSLREFPARTFDVSHFVGSYARARELLGWRPEVPLAEGVRRLAADLVACVAADSEAAQ